MTRSQHPPRRETHHRGHRSGETLRNTRAVNGVDLAVPTGSVYGVLGPNGAGKTTTVSMLATFCAPTPVARRYSATTSSTTPWPSALVGVTGQYASVDEDPDRAAEPDAFRPAARLLPGPRAAVPWNYWRHSR